MFLMFNLSFFFLDDDLITIFDSSDLSFAIQCSRILKLTLFGKLFFFFFFKGHFQEYFSDVIADICNKSC